MPGQQLQVGHPRILINSIRRELSDMIINFNLYIYNRPHLETRNVPYTPGVPEAQCPPQHPVAILSHTLQQLVFSRF